MTLAELGGNELSRSFLSSVERGRSRISLRALTIVARRLGLPMGYFFDGEASSDTEARAAGRGREVAAAYDLLLRCQDHLARVLDEQPSAGEPM